MGLFCIMALRRGYFERPRPWCRNSPISQFSLGQGLFEFWWGYFRFYKGQFDLKWGCFDPKLKLAHSQSKVDPSRNGAVLHFGAKIAQIYSVWSSFIWVSYEKPSSSYCVWCNICGEAGGEIFSWSPFGVKGVKGHQLGLSSFISPL